MFSVPLGSSSRAVFHPYSKYKIPFDQMSLLLCSHYFPHPTIFLYSGLSNHLIWKWQFPDILKAKSTFSNIWFPIATPFNAGNCITQIIQSLYYSPTSRCINAWMHSLKKSVKPEMVNRYDLWVLRHKIGGAKVFVNNVQWSDQMM
jgi:hypothetical protein